MPVQEVPGHRHEERPDHDQRAGHREARADQRQPREEEAAEGGVGEQLAGPAARRSAALLSAVSAKLVCQAGWNVDVIV